MSLVATRHRAAVAAARTGDGPNYTYSPPRNLSIGLYMFLRRGGGDDAPHPVPPYAVDLGETGFR